MPGLHALVIDIVRDLRTMLQPGPRLVDQAEAVASVFLAIALAELAGARNVGWAAFAGFMVIRSQLAVSAQRASLRVLGTLCGAMAGYVVAIRLGDHTALLCVALLVVTTCTGYMAVVGRRTYAWLFTGLTFMMVVVEAAASPGVSPAQFAWTRIMETALGTAASLIVSYVSAKTLRRRMVCFLSRQPVTRVSWEPLVARHAVQVGVAAALVPLTGYWLDGSAMSQAGITIVAVMAIPLADLADAPHATISSRMAHRFAGCVAGAMLAAVFLLPCHASGILLAIGLCIGVAVGRHIENGPTRYGYVGVQFTLAFLTVLVPEGAGHAGVPAGIERLGGIVTGIALLVAVRALTLLPPRWFRRQVTP